MLKVPRTLVRRAAWRLVHTPVLSLDTVNQNVVQAEYAVRGELVLKSAEYQHALDAGAIDLGFDKIIACNIGNPQDLGQRPMSFTRQVLALCTCPELLDGPAASTFPADAIARARHYLGSIKGGTGGYTDSMGVHVVRKEVADFIAARDGHPASPSDIFLTDGASPAVKMMLQVLIRNESDGIMIPIPQYPLYSAGIALCGGTAVNYYLDEVRDWGLSVDALRAAIGPARERGVDVRALAVINPGNPTGQCLPEEDMRSILRFCAQENLVLLADEVYQENIWQPDIPFRSFKKVLRDMDSSDPAGSVELVSFHSVSKGFFGECGRRGGYMELTNIDPQVHEQLYKLASVSLCSNVEGQLTVGTMCNPPKAGEASFETYVAERDAILESLQRRAKRLVAAFNTMEGISCNDAQGALYAFPKISLPQAATQAACEAGKPLDTFYCLELLDATGIVVVPGTGFGQVDGTFHFRTTFLPPEDQIDEVIERIQTFHTGFLERFTS